MMLGVTSFYAGLLTLLYIALSWRVISYRYAAGVSIGDGENEIMQRRMRAHGNAGENIPIGLILLALVELQGAPIAIVRLLGLMLVVGRTMHGLALTRATPWSLGRKGGMGLTFLMLGLSAIGLTLHAIF
ncbi:MAG: MAPEG family protein [Octadecabacter sp.]|nr:MAPEG family protein [Octadecabacter sp.]